MSRDICIYLNDARLPSGEEWAAAIKENGFCLEQYSDFHPSQFSGYLPCGQTLGVDYLTYQVSAEEAAGYGIPNFSFDRVISLGAKNDSEFSAALASISCLALMTGGMVCNPQTGEVFTPEHAMQLARAAKTNLPSEMDP